MSFNTTLIHKTFNAIKKVLLVLALIFTISGNFVHGQHEIKVDIDHPKASIQPYMWGIFFEDINFGADGGSMPSWSKTVLSNFTNP
jgi:alpha-N-arabinofuranosidase